MTITRQLLDSATLSTRAIWLAGLSLCLWGCSSKTDDVPASGGSSVGGAATAGTDSGGSASAGKTNTSGNGSGASGGGSSSGARPLLGTFKVEVTPDENGPTNGTTSVLGKVNDGPAPLQVAWETVATEGDCRLEKPRVPFCSPSCGGGVCVEDDVCQNYPTAMSVGAATLSGVKLSGGETSLVLKEVAKAYQPPAGTTFAYPPFAEGDAVHLSAAGGGLPGFEVETTGVAPLWLEGEEFALEPDKALEITWNGASDPKASSVHVKLDISHHGGSKGMIECDLDDTGSLSISAALVTELLGLGVAGFPTIIVSRAASARATVGSGEVALVVASTTERAVSVPGVESCTDTAQCPSGETCQADLTCQ